MTELSEALIREFSDRLQRAAPVSLLLERLGDRAPESPRALLDAAAHPDLAPQLASWLPSLLSSAKPGAGARSLVEIANGYRVESGGAVPLGELPSLPRVLGCSDFLARLLRKRPLWVDEIQGNPPSSPDHSPPRADWSDIRACKYRGLLRVAARDLEGHPLRQSLRDLSDLADACLGSALHCAAQEIGGDPPSLLALGKLGGRELNFSSDADVIFLIPSSAVAEKAVRIIRRFKNRLEEHGPDGFGYRIDLELRPQGKVGALAHTNPAALSYYEDHGAEWERQMLIRLRRVAGPAELAAEFAAGITPFVYRKTISTEVIHVVRAMKARIESERLEAGRDIEFDVKEGAGGIRDVEFLVQSLQLFHGGRHPELRTGNVLEALEILAALGHLPAGDAESLNATYSWLRRTEHALQMREERQTAAFPRDETAQLELARCLGYADDLGESARAALLDDWTSVRAAVRQHFDALVLEEPSS